MGYILVDEERERSVNILSGLSQRRLFDMMLDKHNELASDNRKRYHLVVDDKHRSLVEDLTNYFYHGGHVKYSLKEEKEIYRDAKVVRYLMAMMDELREPGNLIDNTLSNTEEDYNKSLQISISFVLKFMTLQTKTTQESWGNLLACASEAIYFNRELREALEIYEAVRDLPIPVALDKHKRQGAEMRSKSNYHASLVSSSHKRVLQLAQRKTYGFTGEKVNLALEQAKTECAAGAAEQGRGTATPGEDVDTSDYQAFLDEAKMPDNHDGLDSIVELDGAQDLAAGLDSMGEIDNEEIELDGGSNYRNKFKGNLENNFKGQDNSTAETTRVNDLLSIMESSKTLGGYGKEFFDLVGHLTNCYDDTKVTMKPCGRGEITGLTHGKSLNNLTTSEKFKLLDLDDKDDVYANIFYDRFYNNRLNNYSRMLEQPVSRGPVCVMLDVSTSMRRIDLVAAYAMVFSLFNICVERKSELLVVPFSSYVRPENILKFSPAVDSRRNRQKLLSWCQTSTGGGTDYIKCLEVFDRVLDYDKEDWTKNGADLVFITDGEYDTPLQDTPEYAAFRSKYKDMQMLGVHIDSCWQDEDEDVKFSQVEPDSINSLAFNDYVWRLRLAYERSYAWDGKEPATYKKMLGDFIQNEENYSEFGNLFDKMK